jgi:hypothetical protein
MMFESLCRQIARTRDGLAATGFALLLAFGTAFAQTAPPITGAQGSGATAANSLKLLHVIAALPAGAPWLRLSSTGTGGLIPICVYQGPTQTWTGGRAEQDLPPYAAAFKDELERVSYKVITPGEDNLFDL